MCVINNIFLRLLGEAKRKGSVDFAKNVCSPRMYLVITKGGDILVLVLASVVAIGDRSGGRTASCAL